jgi:hypothetical protein
MSTEKPLVNRIAASGLITLKLETYFPDTPVAKLDLKEFLFKELLLKEKDFREHMKAHDWAQYEGKVLLAYCSSDAIIPMWAYMLVAAYATPYAAEVFQGTAENYYQAYYHRVVSEMDIQPYEGQRVIIKGCTDGRPVPAEAYLALTKRLQPVAKSIMYGEPCSTVPIYKQKKQA